MNCWNMLLVAFVTISCAAAFKVAKVQPKVIILPIVSTMTFMMLMMSKMMIMMIVQCEAFNAKGWGDYQLQLQSPRWLMI